MSYFLCIETATPVCSVALFKDTNLVAFKESKVKNSHSELVTVFIRDLMIENNLAHTDLSAVAVSKGPGSYTGLRIGVSTAKGLCYALDIPLIAIPTLKSIAWGAAKNYQPVNINPVLFCPMIDARRMEVYSAIFDSGLHVIRETKAEILEATSYADYLKDNTVVFLGDGSLKFKDLMEHPHAVFSALFYPSATDMAALVYEAYQKKSFEDVAYFEPYYLKDFIPGVPKVKGLQ